MKIEEYLKEVSSVKHIVDVPIDEFNTIDEITELIKRAKKNGIGAVLHYETSNYHCGVVIQLYDKETCTVKDYLDK